MLRSSTFCSVFAHLRIELILPSVPPARLSIHPRFSMSKRHHSAEHNEAETHPKTRKLDKPLSHHYIKVATAEDAASVDKRPPFDELLKAIENNTGTTSKGDAVVYWMRMEDLRSELRPLVSSDIRMDNYVQT